MSLTEVVPFTGELQEPEHGAREDVVMHVFLSRGALGADTQPLGLGVPLERVQVKDTAEVTGRDQRRSHGGVRGGHMSVAVRGGHKERLGAVTGTEVRGGHRDCSQGRSQRDWSVVGGHGYELKVRGQRTYVSGPWVVRG